MLAFRRLTLADRPAMLDICATVWDGDDYLPNVFENWVADPHGQFTGAELDGRVVALAKLSRLAPGEYWLEGIRVHGDCRGRGLAKALHYYHMDWWRQHGEPGTLRLVTGEPAILSLCAQTGFSPLFEFAFVEAPAWSRPHQFVALSPAEATRAFECLARSPWYGAMRGLCDLGWKWRTLTPHYLAERMAAGGAFRWGDWEAVLLVTDLNMEAVQADRLLIQFPGVAEARRTALLEDARGLAHALGKTRVRWCPPLPLERAGALPPSYARLWDDVEYCWEARQ